MDEIGASLDEDIGFRRDKNRRMNDCEGRSE